MIKTWEIFQEKKKRFNPSESQNIQSRRPLVSHGYRRRAGLKLGFTGAGSLSVCQHRGVFVNLSEKRAVVRALPRTGRHVPAEHRASERLRRGRGDVWPCGTTSLTSTTELHAGARPTQEWAQSEEGSEPGKPNKHSSSRVYSQLFIVNNCFELISHWRWRSCECFQYNPILRWPWLLSQGLSVSIISVRARCLHAKPTLFLWWQHPRVKERFTMVNVRSARAAERVLWSTPAWTSRLATTWRVCAGNW